VKGANGGRYGSRRIGKLKVEWGILKILMGYSLRQERELTGTKRVVGWNYKEGRGLARGGGPLTALRTL